MSSGQKPRTREHFPRMNARASRRRHRRLQLNTRPISDFVLAMRALGKAFSSMAATLRPGFARLHRRSPYALSPQPSVRSHLNARMLGAEPSLVILDEHTGTEQTS